MNLFDMARRGDANLETSDGVVLGKRNYPDGDWRGLTLTPGAHFKILDARRFASLRHFPTTCGWMLDVPKHATLRVAVVSTLTQAVLSETVYEGETGFQPLYLPWPHQMCGKIDVVISNDGPSRTPAFVANHRALSRQWLYDLCVGQGMEIGPGSTPQILPGERTDVLYLEQMPAEEWRELYSGGGKYVVRPELWGNYIVGEASAPPTDDSSLDFIFGSHVFEHLVNPIGHLERWRRKLTAGGKVIMVVPDLNGTKDSVHHRCSLESLLDEHQREIWLPEKLHYMRHLRRGPDDKKLIALMARMESIHAHYYDNINCQMMLDFAVRQLGYSDYVIEHTPNHKDFHFVLSN
ncbi:MULTISPECIES: class I SAM-dependent methyltransferase [unclassified Sphingobium]|uniref:class I SAM-dependent methyltransferase n=1 Tax=unclassified Sphingobium TaxID=2611147 RepID=UPI002224C358|nr:MULTISPECIES: class I SAM-dependent methyltransferase [unclassified Sphingobium]